MGIGTRRHVVIARAPTRAADARRQPPARRGRSMAACCTLAQSKTGKETIMKKPVLALAALAATLSAGTAMAENPTGFYVGGGFGRFNLDIKNPADFGSGISSAVNDNDNSYKIFAGWRLLPFLAVEAAYVNLGEPGDAISSSGSNGRYRLKADGFQPSVIGTVPLGPVELFGKVGYYYYDVDVSTDLTTGGSGLVTGHSRNDLVYGGGVGMTFIDHLHIRAEYERLDMKNYDNSDVVWLSAAWRF
jgi:opacity protein-like surface antigen